MKTRYAIKLELAVDDWIYVTEKDDSTMFGLRPMLFKTRDEAEEYAQTWRIEGKEALVKVVRYRKETENG